MKSVALCALAALVVWGCGGSEGQDVKTPDQLIDEQEKLAIEDEKTKKARGDDPSLGAAEPAAAKKGQRERSGPAERRGSGRVSEPRGQGPRRQEKPAKADPKAKKKK